MKYIWNVELYVQKIGMAHGVLFIVYIVLAFFTIKNKLGRNHLLIILIGSIVPFGFLYVDKKCLKNKT